MTRLLALLLALAAPAALAVEAPKCVAYDGSGVKTLRIVNLCTGAKMWRVGADDFRLICPGQPVPAGAVELRPYYVLPR